MTIGHSHPTCQEGCIGEAVEQLPPVLTSILGNPPRYFRPPWGHSNLAAVQHCTAIQQRRVLWSLRGEGWLACAKPEMIVHTIAQRLHPGAIIDLHDGAGFARTPARLVAALPGLLKLIQEHGFRCLPLSELLPQGLQTPDRSLRSRVWDHYEWAWNTWFGVKKIDETTILTLAPAIHHGPDLVLHDGTMIHPGTQVGELHFDRDRVTHLHRTVTQRHVGLVLRRELTRTLQRLAQMVTEHPAYRRLEAFRSTTMFSKEATRLGVEVSEQDQGWHYALLSWYQQMLLVREHPLGRRRLHGKRWEARTIWLSRQELLRRYAEQRR
jgi:peptidoglycan-N-acetylglucosamine deacetylase